MIALTYERVLTYITQVVNCSSASGYVPRPAPASSAHAEAAGTGQARPTASTEPIPTIVDAR